jgi:NAD(P)-dependent dehydrogenase (short-subunit alcohol dehydrogenase family)
MTCHITAHHSIHKKGNRMDLGLKNRVALVTGGSQGLGKAIATRLAHEGASVVIVARGRELLEQTANEIRAAGGQVATVQADVSSVEDCTRLIREASEAFGRLDILVNNAGTSATGEFESITDEGWQADFDLKLFAAIRLARLAIPHMKLQGWGRIVNINADDSHACRRTCLYQGAVQRIRSRQHFGEYCLHRFSSCKPARKEGDEGWRSGGEAL